MRSYMEHLTPDRRLELAYFMYEAELKRFLRRYNNIVAPADGRSGRG
jgi:hypothetical protein